MRARLMTIPFPTGSAPPLKPVPEPLATNGMRSRWQIRTIPCPWEGWGLTEDGKSLILSDGSSTLRFLDPATFKEQREIKVTDGGKPVDKLNELEYIHGQIYANIWYTDRIARISPSTGKVLGWIDLTGLLSAEERTDSGAVLNGIAYDAAHDRLFVTGKLWPKIFEIRVVPKGLKVTHSHHSPSIAH